MKTLISLFGMKGSQSRQCRAYEGHSCRHKEKRKIKPRLPMNEGNQGKGDNPYEYADKG